MANEEITISELELADEVLADMVLAVDTTTDTRAVTLRQLKAWLGSSLPTGFIVPAVGKISDERFTLLDGKTLARTGTYEAFCNKVIEKVQAGDWQSCTEAQYNQDLADFGQCWKFVITNDYVRIPTFGHELYSEVLSGQIPCKGNGMTLGFSDGTNNGGLTANGYNNNTGRGASILTDLYGTTVGTQGTWSDVGQRNTSIGITTDPTKSGIVADVENIKGNVKVYYYMVVSTEGQQEQIEVDINEVYEDLNLKANTDLSNVNPASSFKEASIDWGIPDYSAGITGDVSLGVAKTFTCPAKGIITYSLSAFNRGNAYIKINNVTIFQVQGGANPDFNSITGTAEVDEEDVVEYYSRYSTNANFNAQTITFYPCKGIN